MSANATECAHAYCPGIISDGYLVGCVAVTFLACMVIAFCRRQVLPFMACKQKDSKNTTEIERFPEPLGNLNQAGECTICLQEIEPHQRSIRTECGHLFHVPCILTWTTENQTCPNCRAPLHL